jgi:uncharacterized protein with NAD-binding domain and iron-sulfur cluster
MSIAIFGAGMAGCTVAHLLCTKGYKVHLFEASNQIGGFVKTFRNKDGIPQEHSPRIVLNNYHLMETIFKDLGIEDHLLDDFKFEDTIFPLFGKPHKLWSNISLTLQEIVLLIYYIIRGLLSTDDQMSYMDFIPVYDIIQDKDSRKWFDTMSLIAGERPDIMPMYKIAKIVKSKFRNFFRRSKTLKGPWSEYFFNYWEKFLLENGVTIHYNTPLKQFDPTINYAIVEKNGHLRYLTTDIFVLATDISNSIEILNKTNLQEIKQLKQNLKQLFEKTKSEQMGMQISFPNKIKTNKTGYFTIQSDWQLIVHMQETTWEHGKYMNSLWSVVIPEMSLLSKRLGKKAIECTPEEIQEEVLHQLRYQFNLPQPSGFYIWPSWTFENNQWSTSEPYFWNAVGTKHLRPKQEILNNLYLVGAYTDTNYYHYYMEGAVESGFLACEKILGQKLIS